MKISIQSLQFNNCLADHVVKNSMQLLVKGLISQLGMLTWASKTATLQQVATLAEDLSLFLAPLSGIPFLYLSEKLSVFQLSKRS